jgi:hypothetical protein
MQDVLQARMKINELTEKTHGLEKLVNKKSVEVVQLKNEQAKTGLALEKANQVSGHGGSLSPFLRDFA